MRALGAANTLGRHGFRADVNTTRSDGFRDGAPYERQSATLRWDRAVGERVRRKTVAAISHVNQARETAAAT